MAKVNTRTFVLKLRNGGTRKITIPRACRLTFGSVTPFAPKAGSFGPNRVALRIYEGDKVIGVMQDVVAFLDQSLAVSIQEVKPSPDVKKTKSGQEYEVEAQREEIDVWFNDPDDIKDMVEAYKAAQELEPTE